MNEIERKKKCPECGRLVPLCFFRERSDKMEPFQTVQFGVINLLRVKYVWFKTCFSCFCDKNGFMRYELFNLQLV